LQKIHVYFRETLNYILIKILSITSYNFFWQVNSKVINDGNALYHILFSIALKNVVILGWGKKKFLRILIQK